METETEQGAAGPGGRPKLNPECKKGRHSFRYLEQAGNVCRNCGVPSEHQDAVLRQVSGASKWKVFVRVPLKVLLMGLAALGAFFYNGLGINGFRDTEMNFLAIDGTAVADGSDQEDSVDLSNYGVSMGTFVGMRIWAVDIGFRPTDDVPTATATDTSSVTLRTISSSAPPDLNDDGVIAQKVWTIRGITTSGAAGLTVSEHGTVFPRGLLIVSDRLYDYFDNELGGTAAVRLRVWFTLEKMTGADWREAWEVWRRA